jgi:hypothetical protein
LFERCEIARKMAICASRPGIVVSSLTAQQTQDAFDIGIEDHAGNAMAPQCPGQCRKTGGRFAGFRHGWMDQEHLHASSLNQFVDRLSILLSEDSFVENALTADNKGSNGLMP